MHSEQRRIPQKEPAETTIWHHKRKHGKPARLGGNRLQFFSGLRWHEVKFASAHRVRFYEFQIVSVPKDSVSDKHAHRTTCNQPAFETWKASGSDNRRLLMETSSSVCPFSCCFYSIQPQALAFPPGRGETEETIGASWVRALLHREVRDDGRILALEQKKLSDEDCQPVTRHARSEGTRGVAKQNTWDLAKKVRKRRDFQHR